MRLKDTRAHCCKATGRGQMPWQRMWCPQERCASCSASVFEGLAAAAAICDDTELLIALLVVYWGFFALHSRYFLLHLFFFCFFVRSDGANENGPVRIEMVIDLSEWSRVLCE